MIFLFEISFKKCFKIVLFSLWHRDVLQFNISILHCSGCVKVAWCRGCMRNTIVFCSWTLQIVLEWLHQGCDSDLSVEFLNFGAGDFPFRNFFWKVLQNRPFFALAPRSGFGVTRELLCVKTSFSKSLLCEKPSVCKNLPCVKAFFVSKLLCLKCCV